MFPQLERKKRANYSHPGREFPPGASETLTLGHGRIILLAQKVGKSLGSILKHASIDQEISVVHFC
jgi:hypothetical protein